MPKVLIVDDEAKQRRILAEILTTEGNLTVFEAADVDEALQQIGSQQPEVVITDLKMAGRGGLALMEEIARMALPPEVIVVTAYGSIDTAVKATRLGAYDYLTKPVKPEDVLFLIGKASEKYALKQESRELKKSLSRAVGAELVAGSTVMQKVLEQIEKVAESEATVLIRGETGTGKECVARPSRCAASTARRSVRRCWTRSSSAMRRAPSRARRPAASAAARPGPGAETGRAPAKRP
jgi:DNA-binding NtrC family response regulator